jgi:uncharacterized phage-associated protein
MRWLEDVSMELRKMGSKELRNRARNREPWRRILEEAKAQTRAVTPFKKKNKKNKEETQIYKKNERHEDIKDSVHCVPYCIIVS